MKKNLVLTGMMGVGKSTVGKILAKNLSYNFIDIDVLVELSEGISINKIFDRKGENYFRKIEREITLKELKKTGAVIALGGGAFMDKFIRIAVKNSSVSFWLDISPNLLIDRLKKNEKRPLLLKQNLAPAINKIYLERKETYNKANFRIKCNSLKQEEITKKIIKLYEDSSD